MLGGVDRPTVTELAGEPVTVIVEVLGVDAVAAGCAIDVTLKPVDTFNDAVGVIVLLGVVVELVVIVVISIDVEVVDVEQESALTNVTFRKAAAVFSKEGAVTLLSKQSTRR